MTDPFQHFAKQAGPRFPTSAGPRLIAPPLPLMIPRDPAAALAFAYQCDCHANILLSEGRTIQADRLAHLAYEARSRVEGGRA